MESKITERNAHIEGCIKVLDKLTKDESIDFSIIDKESLNDKNVAEKYVDYEYKEMINEGDDKECVKDYWVKSVLASKGLRYNLLFIVLFLILC